MGEESKKYRVSCELRSVARGLSGFPESRISRGDEICDEQAFSSSASETGGVGNCQSPCDVGEGDVAIFGRRAGPRGIA